MTVWGTVRSAEGLCPQAKESLRPFCFEMDRNESDVDCAKTQNKEKCRREKNQFCMQDTGKADLNKSEEKNMNLYAPKYYKKFKCIADKCKNSCCVGWEIDIDKATLIKYQALKSAYGTRIMDSICLDDTPHFKLKKGDRCPHLDENGLCKIIINEGESYLCDICREHPRFYNYTGDCEVGLGMSCEEAARIILSSSEYDEMEYIGENQMDPDNIEFDGRLERQKIYKILKDESATYTRRLEKIYRQYGLDFDNDSEYLEILKSLEYLDPSHKGLFLNYSSKQRPNDSEEYLERFLAYFIYRHATEAFDYEDFCTRLTFCMFCERLFASLIHKTEAKELNEVVNLAIIISSEIEYSEDNTFELMI